LFGLVPRDEKFFHLLERTADLLLEAARLIYRLFEHWEEAEAIVARIWELEKESDRVTDDLVYQTNATFVTPLDREDIQGLARIMDRTLNYINSAAYRVKVLQLRRPTPALLHQTEALVQAAEAMREGVYALRKRPREALQHCERVNTIETEGDARFRQALAALFQSAPTDVEGLLELMKLKEIHERVEAALDRCEDVADTIEGSVVKGA